MTSINPAEEVKAAAKEKWKQKSIKKMLGIPKSKRRGGRKKENYVCSVQFRCSTAALPICFEGINRIIYLTIMGLDYMGNDEKVIQKIMIMEMKDDKKANVQTL